VRFQVLTAASMKFRIVFWDVLPCKIIVDWRFRGTCCLHRRGWNVGRQLSYTAVHPRRHFWTSNNYLIARFKFLTSASVWQPSSVWSWWSWSLIPQGCHLSHKVVTYPTRLSLIPQGCHLSHKVVTYPTRLSPSITYFLRNGIVGYNVHTCYCKVMFLDQNILKNSGILLTLRNNLQTRKFIMSRLEYISSFCYRLVKVKHVLQLLGRSKQRDWEGLGMQHAYYKQILK
jgi:hypothetical protein